LRIVVPAATVRLDELAPDVSPNPLAFDQRAVEVKNDAGA
jgi:hypothetical protein